MSVSQPPVPVDWATATLGDLIGRDGVFVDGDWVESKDQDPNGQVRLIQLADVGDGEFRDRSARFLTFEKANELRCTFLEKGDLLIARMPDPLGRCCLFPFDRAESFVTVVDVCIVRPSAHISAKYLMHAINSADIRAQIAGHQSGSTRKRISRGNLATIELPIAPLREQRRIVAKIEELFSELDKGVESLTTAREQLKAYRQSVLKSAFSGELTGSDANDWTEYTVGQLATDIRYGTAKKCTVCPSSNILEQKRWRLNGGSGSSLVSV
jgi:type I restriction enzyme S subunit